MSSLSRVPVRLNLAQSSHMCHLQTCQMSPKDSIVCCMCAHAGFSLSFTVKIGMITSRGIHFANFKKLKVESAPTMGGSSTVRKGALPVKVAMKSRTFRCQISFEMQALIS
jgi:hypothetical protein